MSSSSATHARHARDAQGVLDPREASEAQRAQWVRAWAPDAPPAALTGWGETVGDAIAHARALLAEAAPSRRQGMVPGRVPSMVRRGAVMETNDEGSPPAGAMENQPQSAPVGARKRGRKPKPPDQRPRASRRSALLPASEQERLRRLAQYFHHLYADSGLHGDEVAARARRHVPTIAESTVRRLNSPLYLSDQPGVSWIIVDALVQALGSSHAELDAALAGRAFDGRESSRAAEQERALVRLFRAMPPVAQQYLLEDAQRYVRRTVARTPADLEASAAPGGALSEAEQADAALAADALVDFERALDAEEHAEARGDRRAGPAAPPRAQQQQH